MKLLEFLYQLLDSGKWSMVTQDGDGEPDECNMQVGEHQMSKKPTEDEVDYNKQREECYKNTRLEVRHVK